MLLKPKSHNEIENYRHYEEKSGKTIIIHKDFQNKRRMHSPFYVFMLYLAAGEGRQWVRRRGETLCSIPYHLNWYQEYKDPILIKTLWPILHHNNKTKQKSTHTRGIIFHGFEFKLLFV